MQKPVGYDEEQAFTGDFETLDLGGHICKIVRATVEKTQAGNDMLVILFDIAEGKNKDFYRRQFDRKNVNGDAKWQGVYRQQTSGSGLKFFKGLVTIIEESNNGYAWNWDESTLKGKMFGGVFGQEEYYNQQGEVKLSTKIRFIRGIDAIKRGVEIPEVKKIERGMADEFGSQRPYGSFDENVFPEEPAF